MKESLKKPYDLFVTGDVFLQTKDSASRPFTKSVEEIFRQSRISLINLETTLGVGGVKTAKAYNFQTSPEMADYISEIGVTIANVANNHSLDYGENGFVNTVAVLQERGIKSIGHKIKSADEKSVVENIDDKIIGFLAYHGGGKSLIPGIKSEQIAYDIEKLKKQDVDYIVVSFHWGEEYVPYPSPKQQRFAREVIDLGADIIIGHHPHVVQGVEHYNNGLIFYSLGNFNFNVEHRYHERLITTKFGIGVKFNFCEQIEYSLTTVLINSNYQPLVSENHNRKTIESYINQISKPLSNGISSLFWYRIAAKHYFNNHIPSFVLRVRKYGIKHLFQLLFWLIHPKNYRYYFGMISSLFFNDKPKRLFTVNHCLAPKNKHFCL